VSLRVCGLLPLAFICILADNSCMPTELSPAQTLQNAFEAFARRDWQALADFVDPKALDSLRQDGLGLTILKAQQVQAGEDPSGGYNPQDVVIAESLAKVASERVPGFPKNPTVAELAALSSRDFFIQWCQSAYGSASRADATDEIPTLYRRVIGSVMEGADLAQVLYRREGRGIDMGKPYASLPGRVAVMPLRRRDRKWLLSFNDDLGWSVDFEPFPRRDFPLRVSHESLPSRVFPPVPHAPSRERLAAQPDPAAVVRAAFTAFSRADWTALASFVDEGRLRSFRDQQLAQLALWPEMRDASAKAKASGMGATVFMFNDSFPAGEIQKVSTLRIPGFPPSLPLGKLAALSPADFFAEWCKVAYGVKGTGLKTDTRRDVLGQVFESDTVAHVLYRAERWYAVKVMSLKWSHGGWKVLFNDDIGWIGDLDIVLDRE
jgi:hypothetical protein